MVLSAMLTRTLTHAYMHACMHSTHAHQELPIYIHTATQRNQQHRYTHTRTHAQHAFCSRYGVNYVALAGGAGDRAQAFVAAVRARGPGVVNTEARKEEEEEEEKRYRSEALPNGHVRR